MKYHILRSTLTPEPLNITPKTSEIYPMLMQTTPNAKKKVIVNLNICNSQPL